MNEGLKVSEETIHMNMKGPNWYLIDVFEITKLRCPGDLLLQLKEVFCHFHASSKAFQQEFEGGHVLFFRP